MIKAMDLRANMIEGMALRFQGVYRNIGEMNISRRNILR